MPWQSSNIYFFLKYRFVWCQRCKWNLTDANLIRSRILKRIWCCSCHGQRNFIREWFLCGEHLRRSSTKMAQTIIFKLCPHISNRQLHKTVPAFYLIMSCSFFIAIIRRVLKAYCRWKQSKPESSKNIEKEKIVGMVLLVSWLATYQWKKIENCNSVGAGAPKIIKVVFTDIWRA